jgi:O-acetyl-ADP-ribose deacetylase (regulator of RNase III)
MRIFVVHGDILEVEADTLICSANVFLNLSGGVGGAIRIKHGDAVADRIQAALHGILRDRDMKHVKRGELFVTEGAGTGFERIIHAVAVDAMYESSVEEITRLVEAGLLLAAAGGGKRVALTALATGYGHLTIEQFAEGVGPVLNRALGLEAITICVRHAEEADAIRGVLRGLAVPLDCA